MILLLLILILIEIIYNPRVDITDYDDVLVWYGNKGKRKYFKLIKL